MAICGYYEITDVPFSVPVVDHTAIAGMNTSVPVVDHTAIAGMNTRTTKYTNHTKVKTEKIDGRNMIDRKMS